MADDYPDILIGCTGGGSNFSGLVFPFIGKKFRENKNIRVIACEPRSCPSLTKGKYAYDFGDTGHVAPLIKMHTLGSTFMPPVTHSGGLRYHGMAPMVSHLKELGVIEAATHAVKGAMDAALDCKKNGESKTILFNLCGHGHFDMQAYADYFDNKLSDDLYNESEVNKALESLPKVA